MEHFRTVLGARLDQLVPRVAGLTSATNNNRIPHKILIYTEALGSIVGESFRVVGVVVAGSGLTLLIPAVPLVKWVAQTRVLLFSGAC